MFENIDNGALVGFKFQKSHEVGTNVNRLTNYYSPLVKQSVTCIGYYDNGLPILYVNIDDRNIDPDEIVSFYERCLEYGMFAFRRSTH